MYPSRHPRWAPRLPATRRALVLILHNASEASHHASSALDPTRGFARARPAAKRRVPAILQETDQVIANGRRIGVGEGGRPTRAASCAFRASISAANSIDGNSSARLATMAEMVSLLWREPAGADVVEQIGIGEGAVFGRLQRPNVERHRRPAARGYDAIDQELRGRHVSVLRSSRQHRLKDRFDALRRERVEARPSRLGQRDVIGLASRTAAARRSIGFHLIDHRFEDTRISNVTVERGRLRVRRDGGSGSGAPGMTS